MTDAHMPDSESMTPVKRALLEIRDLRARLAAAEAARAEPIAIVGIGLRFPGGANDVKYFKGTVISVDPADKPTKIVLGVFDPKTADATLTFEDPVTSPVKPGDVLEFSGVADSFVKAPYMLVFKDPEVPSLKKAAAPKKTTRKPVKH